MARAAWCWLLVPLLGLGELGAHQVLARRAPTLTEWRTLGAELGQLRRGDELLVISPDWAEPLARHAFGDAMMPLAQVARADATPYPRALEVSLFGERAEETASWSVQERLVRGRFHLRRLANPAPARPTFDFTAGFGPDVIVEGTGGAPCRWEPRARPRTGGLHGAVTVPAARFLCPGGEADFAGVTVIEDQGYRPRRCLWAAPSGVGSRRLWFRQVPLGTVIRGYGGASWLLARDEHEVSAELTVRVDGQPLGTVSHRGADGWQAFELPLGRHAGSTADLELVVSRRVAEAEGFCFHADSR